MDLFKLLGTIAVDNDAANKALSETSSKAKDTANDIGGVGESGEKSGGKFGAAMSKMGGAAVKVGKAVATGMAVGGAAVTALATKSIQAYADYEQLVGGVETLFKDSAGKVQEYARNAYKTAGMSANEYMETVTSFSASLLQSLDGDTAAAAEKADMAITDMSDNANKMGSDITMIQNAYQGFAKQNYTMLDNLKLGYGGTKEEMERLLADAQAISGIEYDISSYADVVDAIHVIQTEMGITGTTAKEASSTISGSIASMKASWSNLLVAMSDDNADFGSYVNSFVESVSTVADNLMPRITIALNGVVQMINSLAPVIIGKIPELFSTLLPSIISAATGLINAIVAALPGVFSAISSVLPDLIGGINEIMYEVIFSLGDIVSGISQMIPDLAAALIDFFFGAIAMLAQEIPSMIEPILAMLPDLISQSSDMLIGAFYMLFEFIPPAIADLISLIGEMLPDILTAIVEVVEKICAEFPTMLEYVVDGVMLLIEALTEQLPVIIPLLTNALVQILVMLTEQLPVLMPMIIQACIDIVNAIIQNLPTIIQALITALPAILQAVWDAIVMIFQNLPQWFEQLFDGIVNIIGSVFPGAKDRIQAVWEAIKIYISSAVNSIKNIITTYWNSIKNIITTVINSIKNVISTVWEAIKTIIKNVLNIIFSVIKGDWTSVKNSITNILNAIKSVISSVWNAIKNIISSVVNGIKNSVSSAFNGLKTAISNIWNIIKTATSGAWDAIKNAMTKPIEKARDTIKGIIDKVKGFFTGMKLEFPNIKLPHFSIKPSGWKIADLLEGSIPSLGIEWYAKAMNNPMVMKQPTIFGYNPETGALQAGGEAGSEVVAGANTLMGMIGEAVARNSGNGDSIIIMLLERIIEMLAQFFPDILDEFDRFMPADPDDVAGVLAVPMNRELGRLALKKGRGR